MGWNCETLQIPNIIFRQLPSDSPPQASLVLERSLQIAQSEHRPSVKRQLSMSTSHPFGKGGKPWMAGMQIALSLPFAEAKATEKCGKFENPYAKASPHPQEWPWHSMPQRSVGPRPTKWDGDVEQHSKPVECHWTCRAKISMWENVECAHIRMFTVFTHLIHHININHQSKSESQKP